MRQYRWLAAAMALALLTLVAGSPTTAQSDQARLRAVHAIPDAPALDVLAGDQATVSGLPYTAVSSYAGVGAGSTSLTLRTAGTGQQVLADVNLDLAAGADHTAVAVARLSDADVLLLQDDNSLPPAGKARLRFVNVSPGAPPLDVVAQNGTTVFSSIAYKDVGSYVTLDAGSYALMLQQTGGPQGSMATQSVTLQERTVYTLYAVGLPDAQPGLQAIISMDAGPPGGPTPTPLPTLAPAAQPTAGPAAQATAGPAAQPTAGPTAQPQAAPTTGAGPEQGPEPGQGPGQGPGPGPGQGPEPHEPGQGPGPGPHGGPGPGGGPGGGRD